MTTCTYFCPRCGMRDGDAGTCERDGTALAEVVDSSLLGTEVGNYVLVQALGEGGMGAVYRAVQPQIGAEVAIKVLHAGSEQHAQRFLLEAQAVNRVRHANLIKILDTGYLADRRPYLVMELLDGLSLHAAVGKLQPELACYIAAEALDALAAVHAEGIVHRDLKPPNLFLTRSGRVVVLDFGIAKLVDGSAKTRSSALVGTPEYMAPEQIRSQPLDRRTDVYSMGVLLYETITGRRPFAAAITFDMLVQHLERPAPPPRDFLPALAPAIDAAILRALEKEPTDRFQSAAEMAVALRDAGGERKRREDVIAYVERHAAAPTPVPLERKRDAETADLRGNARATAETEREVPARNETRAESQPRVVPPRAARSRNAAIIALAVGAPAVILGIVLTRDAAPRAASTPSVHDAGLSTGVLEIESNPPFATVRIDHVPRGSTPITVTLPAGAHLIEVEHAGRMSAQQAIEVRAGQRASTMLVLPEAIATTTAAPQPADAKPERKSRTVTTNLQAGSNAVTPNTVTSNTGTTPVPVTQPPPETATGSARERKPNPFPTGGSQ